MTATREFWGWLVSPPRPWQKGRWKVSYHAVQRWRQRIGDTANDRGAKRLVQIAVSRAVLIPNRLAARRWIPNVSHDITRSLRREGVRYRATSQALLIMAGTTVVTVFDLTTEDLATMLVWSITGEWLDEPGRTPTKIE